MNRRHFAKLLGLGVFSILPGAGRVWKAQRIYCKFQADLVILPFEQDPNKLIPIFYRRGGWVDAIPSFSDLIKPTTWPANLAETQRLTANELKCPTRYE